MIHYFVLGGETRRTIGKIMNRTPDIMLALERGEIDMSSTGTLSLIRKMVDSGKFRSSNESFVHDHSGCRLINSPRRCTVLP